MANKKQTVVALTLIAIGASGLFGLQALGAPGPSVPPLTAAVAASTAATVTTVANQAVNPDLKDQTRKMLKERMGLTGPEADKLVDSMAEHMQAIHGDQAGAMLDQCAAQSGDGSGGGMMGGSGGGI